MKLRDTANDARVGQFSRDFESERYAILVCARCGSTLIDQRSLTTLACSNCDNEIAFDAHRIFVARRQSLMHDIARAFARTKQQ